APQFGGRTVQQHTCPRSGANARTFACSEGFRLAGKPLLRVRMAGCVPVQCHDGVTQQTVITTSITFHKPEEEAVAVLILVLAFKQPVKRFKPHQRGFGLVGDAEKRVEVKGMEMAPNHLKAE